VQIGQSQLLRQALLTTEDSSFVCPMLRQALLTNFCSKFRPTRSCKNAGVFGAVVRCAADNVDHLSHPGLNMLIQNQGTEVR